MLNPRSSCMVVLLILLLAVPSPSKALYQDVEEIHSHLQKLISTDKSIATIKSLATTSAGNILQVYELGDNKNAPAILVVANIEGNSPQATAAAGQLVSLLLTDWKDELSSKRFYIIPCANPDGHNRFFAKPLTESFLNGRKVNDDMDNALNEDGPEDLNGDGFITTMRQKHPEGRYMEVASNPLLLKKADHTKGETGTYKLYPEGLDNDNDGRINEDGPGGVNPGYNFPHAFTHYTPHNGTWAASEIESRAILEYAFDHPEIAMVISFGTHNSISNIPESNKRAKAGENKYKMPKRWAERLGLDPDTKYPIKELLSMAREYTGYTELTEDELLQWIGAGAAVNPARGDLKYWEKINEEYTEFLKEIEIPEKRLDPPAFPDGSIEEWAYFQYGVPTFALDFWRLSEPEKKKEEPDSGFISLDSLEMMTVEQFIELGEEKISAFLEAHNAPSQYPAEQVIKGLTSGMMDTKQMATFMRKFKKDDDEGGNKSDEALYAFNPDAFLPWQEFNHPTLGKVEIGGKKPYASLVPDEEQAEDLIQKQLPYVKQLVEKLPKILIDSVSVIKQNSDIWKITAWVKNTGMLPYPTHQGKRSQRPSPTVITLQGEDMTILEGKKRKPLPLLEGGAASIAINWLVQAPANGSITVKTKTFSAGIDSKTVKLTEGGTNR